MSTSTQSVAATPFRPMRRSPVLSCPTCSLVLHGQPAQCRRCGQALAPVKETVVEVVREVPVEVVRAVMVPYDPGAPLGTWQEREREYIEEVLRRCDGEPMRASRMAGIGKTTMYRMAKELARSGKVRTQRPGQYQQGRTTAGGAAEPLEARDERNDGD